MFQFKETIYPFIFAVHTADNVVRIKQLTWNDYMEIVLSLQRETKDVYSSCIYGLPKETK